MMRMGRLGAVALVVAGLGAMGCGPKAVRGEEVEGLDDQAMSTGLDRRDLQKLLQENMKALETAPVVKRWEGEQMPSVAVLPLRNETTEHVEGPLDALISDIETTLVNAGHVRVISMEQQGNMIAQIRQQYAGAFDPSQIATWGKAGASRPPSPGFLRSLRCRCSRYRARNHCEILLTPVSPISNAKTLFQGDAARRICADHC
jgi:hypothetical protein